MISPRPRWEGRRSCDLEHRGSGYLHTLPTKNDFADYLATIGVPFTLCLKLTQETWSSVSRVIVNDSDFFCLSRMFEN